MSARRLRAGRTTAHAAGPDRGERAAATYAFRGAHQAGIITPAQDRLHFAAFDVLTDDRAELVDLLERWTLAAEQMTAGEPAGAGAVGGDVRLPPDDTGEALDLPASGLTITFGFGPSLFRDAEGRDRFGIADRQPDALRDLPHFPGDFLDPARSGGDLCVQACADDPQVAVHAVRNLARIGFGTVSVRWSQLGFGRTSTTSTSQSTPRNLFGFKDGTANVKAEEAPPSTSTCGWADDDGRRLARRRLLPRRPPDHDDHRGLGPPAARRPGGVRRPHQGHRGAAVGRRGDDRARLRHARQQRPAGDPRPTPTSASSIPSAHGGARMLRRGYNFVDGSNALGGLDAGLFFIAYVRDPGTHFVPVQLAMSKNDALSEYLKVTGSALFAVPPGVGPGEHVGQSLFA